MPGQPVRIPQHTHRQVKKAAAELGIPIYQLVVAAITDYLRRLDQAANK